MINNKINICIAGGTGYTAGELLRILLNHPYANITSVLSTTSAGVKLYDIHTDLLGETNMVFSAEPSKETDLVFLCLGHGISREFLEKNKLPDKVSVIDLGNDFRIDPHYGKRDFIYGLADTFANEIKRAKNVANPGCFATAIQTALAPLAAKGILQNEVHITGITGSTGAGKSPGNTTHFSYRDNNISIYKLFEHQHLGEIKRTICRLQVFSPEITFVPMRGDFTRGIFASIYTESNQEIEELHELYVNYYKDSPFVLIKEKPVSLKEVVNTNKAILHLEKSGKYLHISSVIDNLIKGASGQAVENMNLMYGFQRDCGLKLKPSAF